MILLDTNLLTRMTWSHDPQSHDVRLVVAMQSYGITRFLTFNAADFRGLPLMVLDPATP